MSLDAYVRNGLKPRHLHLLIALDDFRNVGKVAAHINVSQPAVSKTITEMERGLQAKLFERTPKGIVPTVYGECLIRNARLMLNGLNQTREELRRLMSGTSGYVTAGVLANVVPVLLPQSICLLKQRSPDTNVTLREGTMERLLPQLLLGELDIIVGRAPDHKYAGELESKILSQERLVLVANPQHPLVGHAKIKWADLVGFTWILPPSGAVLREPLEHMLEGHDLPMPRDTIEVLSMQFVTGYLQLSNAIAMMTRDVAQYYENLGQLAILPFKFPRLVRSLGIAWQRSRPLSPSAQLLISCLEEAAQSTPA